MSGKPLAHSARKNRGIPPQPFWEHIERVTRAAIGSAGRAAGFWNGDRQTFCAEVKAAASFHDCGKLAPENQAVLARSSKEPLPIRHEDGGTAVLLEKRRDKAALLVASHHAGLPSMASEKAKLLQKPPGEIYRIGDALDHTRRHLPDYVRQYEAEGLIADEGEPASGRWSGPTLRLALSCLVDADHTDTAAHYREPSPRRPASCRWAERVQALDRYISGLSDDVDAMRNEDRRQVYLDCCDADPTSSIVSCDAAVGSGKTTAVMAYLLRLAQRKGLRHIFVVLPYTNIIQQSVDVYRKALVLPGEDPVEVVAEVHHRAEFQDPDLREMSVLWDAPITVTTAVQFFETLAGNRPARLRKLHELAGSAIFIDEAHAAIPVWLWPQTWLWLRELSNDWGCHFVLASGSLAKFWNNRDIVEPPEEVPDLLRPETRSRLIAAEGRRIQVKSHPGQLGCADLASFVSGKDGPRLVILNTVQSAAVFAEFMRKAGHHVLHLSTALAPEDRERIVEVVRLRLRDPNFTDWTLVATSCVEAGVDFSFRSAVRESCSVASLIQTGGRVNRHGDWAGSEVWDVRLQDPMFQSHPEFEASRKVLAEMLQDSSLSGDMSEVVTDALRRELILKDVRTKADDLRKQERQQNFPEVAKLYTVIDSDTRTVVVDLDLVKRIEAGAPVPGRDLVRRSVQVWARKIEGWRIPPIRGHDELYYWNGPYDPEFLGYMKGVLPLLGQDTGIFI